MENLLQFKSSLVAHKAKLSVVAYKFHYLLWVLLDVYLLHLLSLCCVDCYED